MRSAPGRAPHDGVTDQSRAVRASPGLTLCAGEEWARNLFRPALGTGVTELQGSHVSLGGPFVRCRRGLCSRHCRESGGTECLSGVCMAPDVTVKVSAGID